MSVVSSKLITAEQLLEMGDIGRCELIAGEIVHLSPASYDHGDIAMEIGALLRNFVRPRRLGKVLAAETGFRIRRNPDTVRAPDAAFVCSERIPKRGTKGFFDGEPDLAVEVLSPSDGKTDVANKVNDWLEAGAVSVWVVDPTAQTIAVHRSGAKTDRYGGKDMLDDEPTLPGFELSLEDLFSEG